MAFSRDTYLAVFMRSKLRFSKKQVDMNKNKTLEQIERQVWPEPEYGSHVVKRCHQLRKVPLSEFSVEDLRIMIGQKMSLSSLLPLALDVLHNNPFAEGDNFKGDLLESVLKIDDGFWHQHPELNNRMVELKEELEHIELALKNDILPDIKKFEFM